jgi:O-antigen/teichoic acid export membrane protein
VINLSDVPSRKRAVLISMSCGYIGKLIIIVQGLLLVPLYLDLIGPRIYGLWLASGGVLSALGFMDFGLNSMVVQRISDQYGKKNHQKLVDYFIAAAIIFFVAGFLIFIFGYIVSMPLPSWINAHPSEFELIQKCFQLAVVATVFKVFNEYLKSLGIALLRPLVLDLALVVWQVIGLGVLVALLLNNGGLWSIPISFLVTQVGLFVTYFIYSAYLLLNFYEIKFRIRKNILFDYISISPYLFLGSLGNSLTKNIEPTLISIVLSPEITTMFVVTRRAADLIFQVLNIVIGSTYSSFVHVCGEGDIKKSATIAKHVLLLGFIGSVGGFGVYIATNSIFVNLWVGKEQLLGQSVIFLVAISMFLRVLRNFLIDLNMGLGDIKYTSLLVFIESIFRILLMYVLLLLFGVHGVLLAIILMCIVLIMVLGSNIDSKLNMGLFNLNSWLRYLFLLTVNFILTYKLSILFVGVSSWWGFLFAVGLTSVLVLILLWLMKDIRVFFKSLLTTFMR